MIARRTSRGVAVLLVLAFIGSSTLVFPQPPLYEGRPAFREGSDRCYYVWNEGRKWHVRWTSRGHLLRFSGSVLAEEGELQSLKRIDLEVESRVVRPGGPLLVRNRFGRPHAVAMRLPVVATREQDHIEKEGDRRIVFHARTDADIDGFDFKVNDRVRTLRFILEIDGRSRVEEVEVGHSNAHPPHNPFIVHLK